MPTASSSVTYAFVPRPPSGGRPEAARLAPALEGALRAAHGADVRLELRLARHPAPELSVSFDRPAGRRWFERAFVGTYPSGAWRRQSRHEGPADPLRWEGRRVGLPGEVGPSPPERGALLGAFDAALAAWGGCASLTATFRPVPRSRLAGLERWFSHGPSPAGPGIPSPRTKGLARTADPRPPAPDPWLWSASLDLRSERTPRATESDSATFRSAGSALDGRPWEFSPAPTDRPPKIRSLFTDRELLAWLPGPEQLFGPATSRPAAGDVPLGRDLLGQPTSLPVDPGEGRHFALLGETGMGKSSLLVAIATRAARRGGVVLLDPLGETAELLARELRRSGRSYRWISPTAEGVEANALAGLHDALAVEPVRGQQLLEAIVQALRRVRSGRYVASPFWGPRLEEMLVLAVRAAGVAEGTLEDAHDLLTRAGTGRRIGPERRLPEVAELAERVVDRPDDAEGARRLLREIVGNPTLRRLLCSRAPVLRFDELVAPDAVVLVSGDAATVGEGTARYLLASYLALLWAELLRRPGRPKTFVLLDEAQWFAHEGLNELLRLARRRNVHVGLATQSLASLEESVREAVRTNVADLVVFRSGAEEARDLARAIAGLEPEQLVALPRGRAAVLLGKGERLAWVRTAVLPGDPRACDALGGVGGAASAPEPPAVLREEPLTEPGATESALLARWGSPSAPRDLSGLVEVRVAELRRLERLDEPAIRALGGRLGRSRALVRSEHGPLGAVWWVDPARLAPAPVRPVAAGRRDGSSSAQHL
jgi:Helicase HerA, central domain